MNYSAALREIFMGVVSMGELIVVCLTACYFAKKWFEIERIKLGKDTEEIKK